MAAITQGTVTVSIGQTVYWRPLLSGSGAPCVFKGFLSNTQSSLIMRPDLKTLDVVETKSIFTTANG